MESIELMKRELPERKLRTDSPVANLVPEILQILKRNEVAKAGIFGSYARGEERPGSDLDMLVEFKGRKSLLDLCGVELELERALRRRVDLLTYNSIHPLLKERILGEEIRLI